MSVDFRMPDAPRESAACGVFVLLRDLTLSATCGEDPQHAADVLELMAAGKLIYEPLISDVMSVDDATAAYERVRVSLVAMNGQSRDLQEPFTSGAGNSLRFPGDPLGPASDTVNWRCVVARTLKRAATTRRALDPLPIAPAIRAA